MHPPDNVALPYDACQKFMHFSRKRKYKPFVSKFGVLDSDNSVNDNKAIDALIEIRKLLNEKHLDRPPLLEERDKMNQRFKDAGLE